MFTFLTETTYYALPLSCTLSLNAYRQYRDSIDFFPPFIRLYPSAWKDDFASIMLIAATAHSFGNLIL